MTQTDRRQQVVVSMTSFPAAITFAIDAVKSLLRGSVLPDKLVLYLTFEQFGDSGVPEELLDMAKTNPVFEVRDYGRDIRSYRKLIPALIDFPEAIIVTVDDDVNYNKNMLRDLLRLHEQYPDAVIAHRAKRILPDSPYRKWPRYNWHRFLRRKINYRYDSLQTGVGGVLYPPHSLNEEMMDVDTFTAIAPTADDLWFWAAGVANGTKVLPVPYGYSRPRGLHKPRVLTLKSVNFLSGEDRNLAVLRAILDRYPIVKQRLESEA